MAADPGRNNLGASVQEISERASALIREEIELAKAEVTESVKTIVKGAVVGIVAGVFVLVALLFILHGLAWLGAVEFFGSVQIYWGFFMVAGILLIMAGVGGYLAARWLRATAPPVPEMAIDEARKIAQTVTGDSGEAGRPLGGPPGRRGGPPGLASPRGDQERT